jgi:hypothetical protein
LLDPISEGDKKAAKERAPTAEDIAQASAALDCVRDTFADRDDLNDYEHNLNVACGQSSVSPKTAGLVASAVSFYLREQAKAAMALKQTGSVHFGTIGVREDFYLSLLSTFAHEGNYGVSWITKLADTSGNVATWFASSNPALDMEPGKVYRVTATVKKHDAYKGVAQTILGRCKVLSDSERVSAEAKDVKKANKAAKLAAQGAIKASA